MNYLKFVKIVIGVQTILLIVSGIYIRVVIDFYSDLFLLNLILYVLLTSSPFLFMIFLMITVKVQSNTEELREKMNICYSCGYEFEKDRPIPYRCPKCDLKLNFLILDWKMRELT